MMIVEAVEWEVEVSQQAPMPPYPYENTEDICKGTFQPINNYYL